MDKQTENMVREILEAIEIGTKEANSNLVNCGVNLDFCEALQSAGKMYAGYIGIAICKVIKKYTEGEK